MNTVNLKDYFALTRVVNLDKFPERWSSFKSRASEAGISGFERESAIEGDRVNPPVWWRSGNGAWGCLMSHLRIVQDAIMHHSDGHLLVFEDDAVFSDDFSERLPKIMDEIGDDWDMLYIGGQHLTHHGQPWTIDGKGEVIHAKNINRTHAFAVNKRFLVKYSQHILHAPDYLHGDRRWHIDHQLGYLHENQGFRILAAHPWLCGQAAGKSWTSGKEVEENWWHHTL